MTADPQRPAQPIADPALQAVSSRRRGRLWMTAAIAVAVTLGVAWYAWPKPDQPSASRGDASARPLPVVAAQAKKGSIDVALNALGTVTPRNSVVVRSRVDG